MRYSPIKYQMILDCAEKEKQIGYLFPLDKYHANWEKLNYSSVSAFWKDITERYYKEQSDRGFYDWGAVQECSYASKEELNSEVRRDIYELNLTYLDLIYKDDLIQYVWQYDKYHISGRSNLPIEEIEKILNNLKIR